MADKKRKSQSKQYFDQNPIESIAKGVGDSLTSDLLKDAGKDFMNQLLGFEKKVEKSKKVSGELQIGEEIDLTELSQNKSEKAPGLDILPGLDYRREILYRRQRVIRENEQQLKAEIHQIQVELKKISASSKILEVQFKDVVVEQHIEKPGKYHVNFYQQILSLLQKARMAVEDAGTWLAALKSKKGQKSYWKMFKKYKTTFGLSNERVVATQTG